MTKKKRILVIVTEGPTDEEFYKRVIQEGKAICKVKRYNFDDIKYICADGIGNVQQKALAKFKCEIANKLDFRDYTKIVCFCYDLDVFKTNQKNPPIDRSTLKQKYIDAGADRVIEITADDAIEDFFLIDKIGIKKYLKLPLKYKAPKLKGIKLIEKMFKDANRVYVKGTKVAGLVAALDIKHIMAEICGQLKPLCEELGFNCTGTACNKSKK